MSSHIVSNDAILKIAGQTRFDEGKEDFENNLLSNFQSDGAHVRAKFGDYETKLTFKGDAVEGACTCPDSDGFEFCRHCVALTLYNNKMTQQLFALSKGPDKSKIFAYLLQLDKQELAKQFLQIIEQDDQLKKRFLLKASLDSRKIDYSSLRSEVTKITKVEKQLFSKRQVKHFFARIEAFLQEILDYGHYDEPEKMAKIVEYCLSRINKLLRSLDDSGNQRDAAAQLIQSLYSSLLEAIPGGIEQRVKRFYRHWLTDQFALLGNDLSVYFAAYQESANKQFNKLIEESWARVQKSRTQSNQNELSVDIDLEQWQVSKLANFQLELAKQNHDKETEIQLRSLTATSMDDYLSLAELQHENGDLGQAIRSAKTALSISSQSQLALEFLIGLMELKNDLIDPFYELFERYPSQVLDTLLSYAKRHDRYDEILEKCIIFLKSHPNDYPHELAHVLLAGNYAEEAVTLANNHPLATDALIKIAQMASTNAPDDAIKLYKQAISSLVEKGLQKSNEQAILCIEQIMPLMGGKQAEIFIDYIENLGVRYRNKSAFIQLLKQNLNPA